MSRIRLTAEPLDDRSVPARLLVTTTAGLPEAPFAESVTPLGFDTYRVDLKDGIDQAAAVSHFAGQPGVVRVGEDAKLTAAATPNDPRYTSQWGLTAINAAAGWNKATGTGQTIVAVIDSGIDLTHPDLAANLWRNPGEIPGNGRDDDRNGYVDDVNGYDFADNDGTPTDTHGHGTHVAGIIGAKGNNAAGVSGVAWTTRVMALRFMGTNGDGYTSEAIRAIDYAVANGAKVLNNSWGTDNPDSFLSAALSRARAAGAIVVVAAGNDGFSIDANGQYPANYARHFDNVISVAATDSAGRLPSWSNSGVNTVAVAAPGASILSTTRGGGYGTKSGTSMAAPFVSGAIAVLWDQNPTWTYQQVLARLKASVDPMASLSGKVSTGGELNLARMLGASVAVPPVSPPPVSPPPVSPPPPVTPARRTVAGTGTPAAVSDFRTTRIPFTVTDATAVADVRVNLTLSHPRTGDLQIRLVSPDGRRVVLFNRRAGANLTNVTFGDAAGLTRPEQVLSPLNGVSARGTWTLEIFDVVAGSAGRVTAASLSFTPRTTATATVNVFPPTDARLGTFAAFDLTPSKPDVLSGAKK
jgi:subtilisin family serine protease